MAGLKSGNLWEMLAVFITRLLGLGEVWDVGDGPDPSLSHLSHIRVPLPPYKDSAAVSEAMEAGEKH